MHIRVVSGFNGQHCYFRAVRYCCPITLNTNPKRKSQTAREGDDARARDSESTFWNMIEVACGIWFAFAFLCDLILLSKERE
jgi:hypothetical protein